jgi:sugar phosphate permease
MLECFSSGQRHLQERILEFFGRLGYHRRISPAAWEATMLESTAPQDELGSTPPTHVRFAVLFAACTLAVVTYIHRVGFATASKEFQKPLGFDDAQMGYVFAAFMLAYGVFEVPWGILGDRFGARHLVAMIAIGGSVLTALIALVVYLPHDVRTPLLFVLVVRFLFGMVQAGTFPSISRMMTDWMPVTERGSAQGFIWTSSRLGGTLAPVLLIPLFAWIGDWRTPLVLLAGLGFAWCGLFWPWFRNLPEEMPQVNAAERKRILSGRAPRDKGSHAAVPWMGMIGSSNVWALCMMYGFLGYSGNFFLTLLPSYLGAYRHLSTAQAGMLTSLPFACGIGACLLGGVLSDVLINRTGNRRWGRRLVALTGLTIAGLAIVGTTLAQSTWVLAVLLALTFFGNDLAMGPAWAAAADIGERHAGTLGGAMNMMASLTAALAAIVTGQLFKNGSVVLPFVIFAGSYACGALCWLRIDVTEPLELKAKAEAELV